MLSFFARDEFGMYVAMRVFDFVSSVLLSSGGQQEQSSVEQMRMGGRSVEQSVRERKKRMFRFCPPFMHIPFLKVKRKPLIANNT